LIQKYSRIDSKIFEVKLPGSAKNTKLESREFYLTWLYNLQLYTFLFTDFEINRSENGSIVNAQTDILKINSDGIAETVFLRANDIDNETYESLLTLLEAGNVYRFFKDGSFEKYVVTTGSFDYKPSDYKRSIEIELRKTNIATVR